MIGPSHSAYIRALRAFALILAMAILIAGCRGAASDDEAPTEASTPTLAVSVAKVGTAPMRETLRLLGTTAAMHHVILRAPVAGRVLGMNLKIGDTVRKGQTVAHVLSLEIEAARQGLGYREENRSAGRRHTREVGEQVRSRPRDSGGRDRGRSGVRAAHHDRTGGRVSRSTRGSGRSKKRLCRCRSAGRGCRI